MVAIFGCLVSSSLAGVARDNYIHRDILVVENVRDFAAKHPGLNLQRLEKQPASPRARAVGESVRYTLGARISGERLLTIVLMAAPKTMQRFLCENKNKYNYKFIAVYFQATDWLPRMPMSTTMRPKTTSACR